MDVKGSRSPRFLDAERGLGCSEALVELTFDGSRGGISGKTSGKNPGTSRQRCPFDQGKFG